ncbi:MAG: HigA family addiction module antitoxin [Acidobacteriota bacterium]
MVKARKLQPLHPGETLRMVLADAGITANPAALLVRIPSNRLPGILGGTAETAQRPARLFGTSAHMWLNLQTRYDLEMAEDEVLKLVEAEFSPLRQAS